MQGQNVTGKIGSTKHALEKGGVLKHCMAEIRS